MGIINLLDGAGHYFWDRIHHVGTAYADAWTKDITSAAKTFWSGVTTMASSWKPDRDSFWKGLQLWTDGAVGIGGSVLKGTIGGVFEGPGLHEASVGLDKAYRYGFAYPMSWIFTTPSAAALAADEARRRGEDPHSAFLEELVRRQPFGERGMWSEDARASTPGQSMIWAASGLVGAVDPGNPDDPFAWLRSHDPRTPEGQAQFNSPNANFLLKYGSGTIDLLANVGVDPAAGLAMATKAARMRWTNVATDSYVRAGGVEREIGSKHYQRFLKEAKDAPSPEALRWKAMPYAPFGGQASVVLWTAAKMGDDVFRDAYVVARGIDGWHELGMGAWDRLVERAPRIASDFARHFANWNIGEDSLMLGRDAKATNAVEALVLNDVDAFVSAMVAREGIWGTLPGKLKNVAQPKVTRLSSMRAGIHTWAMDVAPIKIGRPLATGLQNFLPSQGWTAFIDAEDPGAISLRQFKANLERSGMAPERVEHWVSNWAAKGSREGRNEVFERAETEAIELVANRLGLSVDTVKEAIPLINRYRSGARQLIQQQRVYISERAARLAAYNVALGRAYEARALKVLNRKLSRAAKKGEFGDLYSVMPDGDGAPNLVPLPDTREMPEQAPDMNRPVLLSQTEQMIPTIDYRALAGQLKWYKRQHPGPDANLAQVVVGKAAKVHSGWDALVTAADFANVVWKSSALLRPAQTPRNLADDVLRRMLVFGKLPLIMGTMTGVKRVFQNHGIRGAAVHDAVADALARRGASRTRTLSTSADVDGAVVTPSLGDVEMRSEEAAQRAVEQYGSIGDAWKAGAISLDDLVEMLDYLHAHKTLHTLVPAPLKIANDARHQRVLSTEGDVTNKAPQAGIWHERAFKRRIIEYYYGDRLTRFLDDMRLNGTVRGRKIVKVIDEETGKEVPGYSTDPLDPRYHPVDQRAIWLMQLINRHSVDRRGATTSRLRGGGAKRGAKTLEEERAGGIEADRAEAPTHVLDNPYRPAQMVVDPFTGVVPKDFDSLDDFTILYHDTLDIKSQVRAGQPTGLPLLADPSTKMLNFIVDNVDDLMKPDHMMSLSVMPDGNIRVGVARALPQAVARAPLKPSGRQRLKNLKFKELLDAGHEEVKVQLRSGDTVTFRAAFGGPDGEAMQHRVSAVSGQGTYNYIVGDTNMSRVLDQMGGWGKVRPGERGYAQSWERAVNAQLAGDPVARLFLEGKTDSDVLTWIESTREGTKYLHRMHYFGVNYVDHIRQIEAMVNEYVPYQDTVSGRTLRQAVLERKATVHHLDAVVPEKAMQPEVHGASLQFTMGKGAIFDMVSRGIDRAQKLLSDLPTDKASRYPFFAEAYRRSLTDLVRTADFQHVGEDFIPIDLLNNLEKQARDTALYETKYRLYDVAQMNDLARLSRFVVPFSSAIMDSYLKYGRIVRDNPGTVLQGAYYWEMFERNEMTQDENGYVLKYAGDGSEKWYAVDPETQKMTEVPPENVGTQRYVQFRLPSDLGHMVGRKYFGVDMEPVFAVNKKGFNVFIDLPAAGPMVAVVANEFALDNPEFGDRAIIRKFVLPFGPSVDRGKLFLPSTVRTAWDRFVGEEGVKAEGQAKAIFQAELISYARGERDNPPSFVEARNRAAMMRGLRFAASWISPVSFQTVSPYQPYIDAYRQLAAVDPEHADEAFLARYGDEFYAVAMSVTRNNAGVRATIDSNKAFQRHKELIAAYPELAGLITGQDAGGAFSKSVYEAQKEMPIRPGSAQRVREVMDLDESVADLEKRRVWDQYTKMMDLITADMADKGLNSLKGARAKQLKAIRDGFIEANKYWIDPASGARVPSPWYRDYSNVDETQMDTRIEAMWQIVQDPDLQKRDDIRGLIDYLTARERVQEAMAARGFRTLSAAKAKGLAAQWQSEAFRIREGNPAFGALWNRWLSHDDELTLTGGGTTAAY